MKRFLIFLVLVAGGLAAAAFSVPSNAAVVNGDAITQSQLNSDVSTIAGSAEYACFLNAEEVVGSRGQSGLPAIDGVGSVTAGDDHPTATTAFVSTYLDTAIGHQLVLELAARRHLVVTARDITAADQELQSQITAIMQDVSGSQYACGSSTAALTGGTVLATLPPSFVKKSVQFDATVSVLEEALSGVGSTDADLERYFGAHSSVFDTACFTVAGYSTSNAAEAARAQVYEGASFATLSAAIPGGGPQGCDQLYGIVSELPASADLDSLPLNTVSAPISYNGSYLLLEITSRSPTPFATAKSEVQHAVQSKGAATTQKVIDAAEKRASVWLDPRYGSWVPKEAQIVVPEEPLVADVFNPLVDNPVSATSASTTPTGTASPATGSTG